MQGKRFVASNMRLALKMVREELGPDAIILSNKRVPEGVELLTTVDPQFADQHDGGNKPKHNAIHSVTGTAANPFSDDYKVFAQQQLASKSSQPSRLESEVEKMRLETKRRAEKISAELAAKRKSSLAQDASETSDNIVAINQQPPRDHDREITSVDNNELEQMRNELHSMRDLLEQQLSSMTWGQFVQNSPEKASMWRRLKRMGLDAEVAKSLVEQVCVGDKASVSWQVAMDRLSRLLPVVEVDIVAKGGVFAFVGPAGAGKTTTIAKLAAQYVLEHGAQSVALVTTDTLRIAAQEQLRTVARILNVPIKIVDKNNALHRVLYSLRHKSLVLIDTAGLQTGDKRLDTQLNAINEMGDQIKSLLVIPTTSQLQVIKTAFTTYKTDNLHACVLTKLDEASSLGESLSLVAGKTLPVAYTTNGQNIPRDISVANNSELVRATIKLAKHTEVDEAVMADDIALVSYGR